MRTRVCLLFIVALGTAQAGCAGFNRESGAGGGAAVSGEEVSTRALTGSATDSPATNGSDTTGEALPSSARPNQMPR